MRARLWIIHLQHRLALTPAEFSFLSALVGLLLLGSAARMWIAADIAVDDKAYDELDAQFAALVQALDSNSTRAPAAGAAHTDSADERTGHQVAKDRGFGPGLVDLNMAGLDELISLPGIGPTLAQRILTSRSEHGPFRSPDDLTRVGGIGPAKLARLRDFVRVSEPPDVGDPGSIPTAVDSTVAG